jgi:hypothetical protein
MNAIFTTEIQRHGEHQSKSKFECLEVAESIEVLDPGRQHGGGFFDDPNQTMQFPECLAVFPLRSWRLCEKLIFCRPTIRQSFQAALKGFGLFNFPRKGARIAKENLSGRGSPLVQSLNSIDLPGKS